MVLTVNGLVSLNTPSLGTSGGRLTLTTAVPVLTANVAAAGTVFYTPYLGNRLHLWSGSAFVPTTFSELSNVLANSATGSAGPAAGVSNANYDLFVWNNAGTPTLTRGALWSKNATVTTPVASPGLVNWTTHGLVAGTPVSFSGGVLPTGIVSGTTYYVISAGLAASAFEISATVGGAAINFTGSSSGTQTGVAGNDTARSTGTENDLVRVQGVLTNLNAITNGPAVGYGTYVGTIRTDSSGATVSWHVGASAAGGTAATLNVWNMYNRMDVRPLVIDSNVSWAQTSSTVAALDAGGTGSGLNNRISFVRGLGEDSIEFSLHGRLITAAAAGTYGYIGMGINSVTAISQLQAIILDNLAAGQTDASISARLIAPNISTIGIGFNWVQALQNGDNVHATTFYGAPNQSLTAALKQ